MRTFVMLLVGLGAGFLIANLIWGSSDQVGDAPVAAGSENGAEGSAEAEAADPEPGYIVGRERPDANRVRERAFQLAVMEAGLEARGPSELVEAQAVGAPEPPPDLDARFSGDSMSAALAAAFAELEMEGIVLGVDCAEYPCAVMGSFPVQTAMDSELLPNLLNSESLSIYREDGKNIAAISVPLDRADRQGPARQFFAASFHPTADVSIHEALQERFSARFDGLAEKMVEEHATRQGSPR